MLPPMAKEYIKAAHACLKEAATTNYNAIQKMWSKVTGVVALVQVTI